MGKLNILKHKSWHVYSDKNMERVRKDEAIAKQKVDQEKEHQNKIESEKRLDELRSRKRKLDDGADEQRKKHLNFFEEEEQQAGKTEGNKEYEEEKAREKKKEERLFNAGLGGDEEQRKFVPWYAKDAGSVESKPIIKKKSTKSKYQDLEDPLVTIKRSLKESDSDSPKPTASSVSNISTQSSAMEELRLKRLIREQKEREKANALLGISTFQPKQHIRHEVDKRYYHSQFNPHVSKRSH